MFALSELRIWAWPMLSVYLVQNLVCLSPNWFLQPFFILLPTSRRLSGWRSYSGFACMTACQSNTGAWSLLTTCWQLMLSWPRSWWRVNCWRSWLWWANKSQMRRGQQWSRQLGNVSSNAWNMASLNQCLRQEPRGCWGCSCTVQSSELRPPGVSVQLGITAVTRKPPYKRRT